MAPLLVLAVQTAPVAHADQCTAPPLLHVCADPYGPNVEVGNKYAGSFGLALAPISKAQAAAGAQVPNANLISLKEKAVTKNVPTVANLIAASYSPVSSSQSMASIDAGGIGGPVFALNVGARYQDGKMTCVPANTVLMLNFITGQGWSESSVASTEGYDARNGTTVLGWVNGLNTYQQQNYYAANHPDDAAQMETIIYTDITQGGYTQGGGPGPQIPLGVGVDTASISYYQTHSFNHAITVYGLSYEVQGGAALLSDTADVPRDYPGLGFDIEGYHTVSVPNELFPAQQGPYFGLVY